MFFFSFQPERFDIKGKCVCTTKTVGNLMNRSMFLTVNLNFGFFPCPTREIQY